MKFEFLVAVEVKNDVITTRDNDPYEIAMMLQQYLEDNKLSTLPWVLSQDTKVITRDMRGR